MARRISPSQLRSKMRQAQHRHRAAVQRFNSEVRAYNTKVRRQNAAKKRAIDEYNRQVRAYNAKLTSRRARINTTLSRLRSRRSEVQHATIYQSAVSLWSVYETLDRSEIDPTLVHLAERDTANSLSVATPCWEKRVILTSPHNLQRELESMGCWQVFPRPQ